MKQVKFVDAEENQMVIDLSDDKKNVRLMIKSGKNEVVTFNIDKKDCNELVYELVRLKTTL